MRKFSLVVTEAWTGGWRIAVRYEQLCSSSTGGRGWKCPEQSWAVGMCSSFSVVITKIVLFIPQF